MAWPLGSIKRALERLWGSTLGRTLLALNLVFIVLAASMLGRGSVAIFWLPAGLFVHAFGFVMAPRAAQRSAAPRADAAVILGAGWFLVGLMGLVAYAL